MLSTHSSSVCLVLFPLSLCLAIWFWPDLMNGRHFLPRRLFPMVRVSSCGPIACWFLHGLHQTQLIKLRLRCESVHALWLRRGNGAAAVTAKIEDIGNVIAPRGASAKLFILLYFVLFTADMEHWQIPAPLLHHAKRPSFFLCCRLLLLLLVSLLLLHGCCVAAMDWRVWR